MTAEREKALDLAISQIQSNFGKGAIMRLGEFEVDESVKAIPTGSLSLDLALGVGGVPRGRVVYNILTSWINKSILRVNHISKS